MYKKGRIASYDKISNQAIVCELRPTPHTDSVKYCRLYTTPAIVGKTERKKITMSVIIIIVFISHCSH